LHKISFQPNHHVFFKMMGAVD